MSSSDDAFWDELGFAWRASIRDREWISRRLETRLKLQSVLTTGATASGLVASLLGLALSAWAFRVAWSTQIWHFFARGATLAAGSLLVAMAALALRRRNGAETASLRGMLRASMTRAQRLIRATDLSCCALVVVAVGGTIGYVLRSRLGRPPSLPLAEDLMALALVGVALAWYRTSQARVLKKCKYLDQAFGAEDEQQ